ncbi:MAG: lipopolysaccharide biosynthesis protein [Christensenellales bacterium]
MTTRTHNSIRNSQIGILKFLIQIIFQFVIRTILIYVLGKEYVGLSGLFSNIIGMLSLAELGIGSAIVFSMYKPIKDDDKEVIGKLLYFYKKCYYYIALTVAVIGLLLVPFLPNLANGGYPENVNIYIIYFSYLTNTLISYFMAHKRALLFANQRNDIENKIKILCLFLLNITQIILLLIFKSYNIYIAVLPLFTILESILVSIKSKRLFHIAENKEGLDDKLKSEIKKNVVAMSMHQIGGVFVTSTDNILLSVIFGLSVVGVYTNYNLILTSLISIFSLLISATQASIGNKIASSPKEDVYKLYNNLNFIFVIFVGWCAICLICLFQDFIQLWTKGTDYLLSFSTVVIIVLAFYSKESLGVTYMFKNGAGLMWFDKLSPVIQGVTNICLSIIFCLLLGVEGVFIGTLLSTLIAPFWMIPRTLFKHYFNKNLWEYFKKYISNTVILTLIGGLTYFVCSLLHFSLLVNFILKIFICIFIPTILLVAIFFKASEFNYMLDVMKSILNKLKRKTSK